MRSGAMSRATSNDPFERFGKFFDDAAATGIDDPNAMVVSSVDAAGAPSSRVILLKDFDAEGFVFYTNLESRKATELRRNPRAALCVYWASLDKQIRVEGVVEPVEAGEADTYFDSRPRGSQLGAWTSKQSAPLASRKDLLARYLKIQARFAAKKVPRPQFWGGFRVIPDRIEIWHNQNHRLHDRFLYLHTDEGWSVQRLYP